jgi:predicted DNA binding protein
MGSGNHPIIVELEQVHRCISIAASDKLKGVKIKWLATIGQDELTVSNMFEIPTTEASRIVKAMKENSDVVDISVIRIGEKVTEIIVRQKKGVATAPHLAKTGVAWIPPTWSENGTDRVTLLAPGFKNLKAFLDMVSEEGYELKLKSRRNLEPKDRVSMDFFRTSGFTKLKSASELLTDRQMEAFDLACRYGYYEEPKRISIAELAQKLDVSDSTFAELLRKAEKKLLPILDDILRMIR